MFAIPDKDLEAKVYKFFKVGSRVVSIRNEMNIDNSQFIARRAPGTVTHSQQGTDTATVKYRWADPRGSTGQVTELYANILTENLRMFHDRPLGKGDRVRTIGYKGSKPFSPANKDIPVPSEGVVLDSKYDGDNVPVQFDKINGKAVKIKGTSIVHRNYLRAISRRPYYKGERVQSVRYEGTKQFLPAKSMRIPVLSEGVILDEADHINLIVQFDNIKGKRVVDRNFIRPVPERRRLTNQRLIDRFVRESIR